ncbi:MAG: tetratricopeptide repeat protein [Deltaproteobacteria bacterium]
MVNEREIVALIAEGIGLARQGEYGKALKIFDKDPCCTLNPVALSYYALCLAMEEGRREKAISLCVLAAEKESIEAEIYLNLGRILLISGRKTQAIRAFRKGLKLDGGSGDILIELDKLGIRKKPLLTFLPRASALNRLIGILVHRRS